LVACAIQRLALLAEEEEIPIDASVLEDLVKSLSFIEVSKKSLASRLCTVLCDTNNDKSTLLEVGGIILPLERHEICVTFASTANDTARTFLPKDIRFALKTHMRLFFSGGLILDIASSIPAPPGYIFQAALLTLLCLEQHDEVLTPSERPRQGSDILAGIPPMTEPRG